MLCCILNCQELSYSVTYDSNGGGVSPVDENIYAHDSYAIVKGAPTPPSPDQVFLGWLHESGRVYFPGEPLLMQADTTLIAQWDLYLTCYPDLCCKRRFG